MAGPRRFGLGVSAGGLPGVPAPPREPRPDAAPSILPARRSGVPTPARSAPQLASISGRFTVDHLGRYRAENVNKIRVFSPITAYGVFRRGFGGVASFGRQYRGGNHLQPSRSRDHGESLSFDNTRGYGFPLFLCPFAGGTPRRRAAVRRPDAGARHRGGSRDAGRPDRAPGTGSGGRGVPGDRAQPRNFVRGFASATSNTVCMML